MQFMVSYRAGRLFSEAGGVRVPSVACSRKGNPIRCAARPDASSRAEIEYYRLKSGKFEAGTDGMDAVRGLVQGGIIYIFYFAHFYWQPFRMEPESWARLLSWI
jgi:hypothetical protein